MLGVRAASLAVCLVTAFSPCSALGEPHVLRLATVAPDGTAWAHELRAMANDVERLTNGGVRFKWYFGSVTGDEDQTIQRVRVDQLDGIASGGMACNRLAPSLRALRSVGLFEDADEFHYVIGQLTPKIVAEFSATGFTFLGAPSLGFDRIFTRIPATTLSHLRTVRLWTWDLDHVLGAQLVQMGMHPIELPIDRAATAYAEHTIDGFVALPASALAFQWSAEARYVVDLPVSHLGGCFIISKLVFDALSRDEQEAVRAAAAKMVRRVEEMGTLQDTALLGSLFQKQGLQRLPADATLRREFSRAAASARNADPANAVLVESVVRMLAELRHGHRQGVRQP